MPILPNNFQATFAAPESVGLDSARLDRIGTYMRDAVTKGKLPNAMTLVARHGKIVYFDHCGRLRDNQGETPVQADTLFRIYSMTKPITSVALMMLVEQGKALLSDPVFLYLGQGWNKRNMKVVGDGGKPVACAKNITIKMLLTHTSGLGYGPELDTTADKSYPRLDKCATLEAFVDKLSEVPLGFQPGTRWKYSYSTDVCGRLVEVISGLSLDEFFQTEIFTPLGMKETSFHVVPHQLGRFSDCWLDHPISKERLNITPLQTKARHYTPHANLSGGGGLVSTIGDYYRFVQFLMNGGELDGQRLLSRKTLEWMTTNHLPDNKDMVSFADGSYTEAPQPGVGFGLGFSVCIDPARSGQLQSRNTFGWGGLANTTFFCDPEEGISMIFMTQVIGIDRLQFPYRAMLSNFVYGAVSDGLPHSRM